MTDPQQITEEVPFHILDGAAKKIYEGRFPGHWDSASASTKDAHREAVALALPMLRRFFTARGTLSCEDREELTRIADIIGGVHRPCADPELHEDDARFLRKLGSTQQPVGVGADLLKPDEASRYRGDGLGVSADSDGNQQPLGGDADAKAVAAGLSDRCASVAGGGSGQGAGSALIRCKVCGFIAGKKGEVDPFGPWRKSGCVYDGEHGPTETVEQPSDGQEGDLVETVAEWLSNNATPPAGPSCWRTRAQELLCLIDGQEGGVEEGAGRG